MGSCERGLRLLSLDGGGIRGLSELIILREMMKRIKAREGLKSEPLPCERFDIIGGTSTGGLIALMLGRLRMSVDEAIRHYGSLAKEVFSKRKWGGEGKFKASTLERVVKKIVQEKTGDPEARMMDSRHDAVCKAFVCAMAEANMGGGIPRLFRTYAVPKNQSVNCTIWEAARATSAAPTFFKAMGIMDAGVKERFIDGGLRCNNPTDQVLQEAELLFPGRPITCIVSIGTGYMKAIGISGSGLCQPWVRLGAIIKALRAIATDCEETAENMRRRFIDEPSVYFRFNVHQGMQGIGLEEWKEIGKVKTHTEQYLRTTEVDQKLNTTTEALEVQNEVSGQDEPHAGDEHSEHERS